MVKLEVGEFYRTRDGRKVGPVVENTPSSSFYPQYAFRCDESGLTYLKDGTYVGGEVSDEDIIAEWTDPPAEVIGENVRVIPINEAPDEVFERMAETRSTPYTSDLCACNAEHEGECESAEIASRSKYHRIIKGVELDIYDILVAWGVTCPARQHAIKKLFMAGQRGAKGVVQDLDEAIQATERAKELVE